MADDDLTVYDPAGKARGDDLARAATDYGVAAMGFSVLGGLLKGMAAYQSGQANAGISRTNAHLADLAAGDARVRGQISAAYALLRGTQKASEQKAAYAGSGVDVSSGSAMDVLGDTKMMSDIDARTIENNAALTAWGYEATATSYRNRANVEEATGRAQLTDSILGGVVGAADYRRKMLGWG